jgi:hypothetical protein
MNRRAFLRALGIGAAVVTLSPILDFAEILEPPSAATIDMAAFDALLKDICIPAIADELNQRSILYEHFLQKDLA